MKETFIIVGAGHAAGQAAASLRQKCFEGRIVIIGDEPWIPYQRPPLSKKFLAGDLEIERLYFKPERFYPEHNIDLVLSTRVTELDTDTKAIRTADGETVEYDKLLLTTGGRVREIPVPGNDLGGVHYLRNIADVKEIQGGFLDGSRLVIVGAGYIGLEVAAVAVKRGLDVTVLETEERALSRVTAPEVSEFFERVHQAAGVKLEFGRMVSEFGGSSRLEKVVCADGSEFAADLAIVGIGIIPNIELAEAAGISCENGIVVNEFCETSAPDVYAAGDCTFHPNELFGRCVRLESVHNALEQAKTAATAMCGEPVAYAEAPWFWSDQYDIKLQITGLNQGYDQVVVRGDRDTDSFAAFYLQDRRLLAVDAINSPREFMLGKKLVAARAKLSPEELADPKKDFKELATAALKI
jgi:3-phenylpropionate/trans-cinnamate dioxygenase ferredoxin reductase subunit